jgi:hypothetical protein
MLEQQTWFCGSGVRGHIPVSRKTVERSVMERVLFSEKPETDSGLFAAVAAIVGFDSIVMLLLLFYLSVPWFVIILILSGDVSIVVVIYSFIRFREVRITNKRVIIRFGVHRSSIPISNIRKFSVEDPPSWTTWTSGVSGWRSRVVYCFKSSSPFVMIERDTIKLRRVYFNVADLPNFITRLRKLKEPQ